MRRVVHQARLDMAARLMREGLASKCWLAQSKGYAGCQQMPGCGKWSLVQQREEVIADTPVDLDVARGTVDIGNFGR